MNMLPLMCRYQAEKYNFCSARSAAQHSSARQLVETIFHAVEHGADFLYSIFLRSTSRHRNNSASAATSAVSNLPRQLPRQFQI